MYSCGGSWSKDFSPFDVSSAFPLNGFSPVSLFLESVSVFWSEVGVAVAAVVTEVALGCL